MRSEYESSQGQRVGLPLLMLYVGLATFAVAVDVDVFPFFFLS